MKNIIKKEQIFEMVVNLTFSNTTQTLAITRFIALFHPLQKSR